MIKSARATQQNSTPTSLKEVEILKKAIGGDANAFAYLYENYVEEVYRFIYYRVSNKQTAEDITSQVFIKAWDNLGRYQLRGLPFNAWLFRIARNSVIDHYRTRKETVPLETEALSQPDPSSNVAREVERRLEGEQLRTILDHLTKDQREVLTLKFLNGLKTKEVAKVMGKRPGAIRALQMRALKALANIMGGKD